MRQLLLAVAAFAVVACSSSPPAAGPVEMTITEGRPFPAVVLPNLDGGLPASIAQFRGKKTLLHVFASW